MYIWTEDLDILNLDHYAQVTVRFHGATSHSLSALHPSKSGRPKETIIARFADKLDANYANCLLFKALMDHAGAWDVTAIVPLSRKWELVNTFFKDSEPRVADLLTRCKISVTGLQEVTILSGSSVSKPNPLGLGCRHRL